MATEERGSKVTLEDNSIRINNMIITDSEMITFFQNLNESVNLEEKVKDLLKIGVSVSKSIGTAENISYVDKAFENLDSKFTSKLQEAFGDDGQFSDVLKDNFGEDGRVIKELFNPNKEGSPLYLLKKEITCDLEEIRDKIGVNKAVAEEYEKGTQKGLKFEELCEEKLEWIAQIHADKLEATGTTKGNLGASRKGDFVMTLGGINRKIVFEMKDRARISSKDIQKELKEAIENREADYGIFVVKNRNALPDEIGWFNEYDGNQLVCACENDDGEEIIDGEIIHIAYKWARAKLSLENSNETRLDPAFINEKVGEIKMQIGEMRSIKTQCTSIEKSTERIRKTSDNTENMIKGNIDEIVKSLSKN